MRLDQLELFVQSFLQRRSVQPLRGMGEAIIRKIVPGYIILSLPYGSTSTTVRYMIYTAGPGVDDPKHDGSTAA